MVRTRVEPAWVITDPPGSGVFNMAVDEALLETTATGGRAVLRFYRWREATLSLGYFQQAADRQGHRASRHCPLVRRASGGGAIVHDDELTYTLVLPASHRLAAGASMLYRTVHGTLALALLRQDIPARFCRPVDESPAGNQRFLCFQRRAAVDLVVGQTKVVGSAQRRRKGATLQHGSLLLGRSRAAPELAGVTELAGIRPDCGQLMGDWIELLGLVLAVQFEAVAHTARTTARARELAQEKYGSAVWTTRR